MKRSLFITLFFFSVIFQIAIAEEKPDKKPQGRPPAIVVVDQAVKESIAPTAFYSANVISRDDANLSAELAGKITWVAEVGDRFATGETVVKLDDVFIKQQVIEEQSIIQSEKAKYDLHTKEVKRFTELIEDNNIARNQLDQAISDQAVARSNMASAKARLTQAEERLRRTQIKAPFDGVVSERLLQSGEWANNGNTILRLVSSSNLEIQTHIPASSLQFVTIGTPINYIVDNIQATGKVRALVPIGGNNSRLYELRISAEGDGLIAASVAERVQVETGISDLHRIEVLGDIQVSDRVITRGAENLRPGSPVTVATQQTN